MQSPGVHFPPPLLFLIPTAIAVGLDRLMRFSMIWLLPGPIRPALAWVLIGVGIGVLAWAMATFAKAKTGIYPNQPATTIIERGPYRYSRNPMYVAMTLLTSGIGLLIDIGWVFVLLPVALIAITVFVIRREEAYLATAFGDEYRTYCTRVRRWL
jgi:protein-S-isoprenylcysteine O-methyltransferase Ste14